VIFFRFSRFFVDFFDLLLTCIGVGGRYMDVDSMAAEWTTAVDGAFRDVGLKASADGNGRQRAALLTAVHETVRGGGGSSAAAYSAALMGMLATLLATQPDSGEDQAEAKADTVANVLYLISLVFPKVPQALLRKRTPQLLDSITAAVDSHAQAASSLVLRHGLKCIGLVLRAQDASEQPSVTVVRTFTRLLHSCVDPRPKVRHGWMRGHLLRSVARRMGSEYHPSTGAVVGAS
jgi:hypothetical protein